MSEIDRAELRRLLDEAETPWTIEQIQAALMTATTRPRRDTRPVEGHARQETTA